MRTLTLIGPGIVQVPTPLQNVQYGICVVVAHCILAGCHENQRLGRRNVISFISQLRFARGSEGW